MRPIRKLTHGHLGHSAGSNHNRSVAPAMLANRISYAARTIGVGSRALAKGARTEADRAMLEEIAAEFDAEAEKLEAVDVKPKDD